MTPDRRTTEIRDRLRERSRSMGLPTWRARGEKTAGRFPTGPFRIRTARLSVRRSLRKRIIAVAPFSLLAACSGVSAAQMEEIERLIDLYLAADARYQSHADFAAQRQREEAAWKIEDMSGNPSLSRAIFDKIRKRTDTLGDRKQALLKELAALSSPASTADQALIERIQSEILEIEMKQQTLARLAARCKPPKEEPKPRPPEPSTPTRGS